MSSQRLADGSILETTRRPVSFEFSNGYVWNATLTIQYSNVNGTVLVDLSGNVTVPMAGYSRPARVVEIRASYFPKENRFIGWTMAGNNSDKFEWDDCPAMKASDLANLGIAMLSYTNRFGISVYGATVERMFE